MTTIFRIIDLLHHALSARASTMLALIGAIAVLVLALAVAAAVVITTIKGRSELKININLGRSPRNPP